MSLLDADKQATRCPDVPAATQTGDDLASRDLSFSVVEQTRTLVMSINRLSKQQVVVNNNQHLSWRHRRRTNKGVTHQANYGSDLKRSGTELYIRVNILVNYIRCTHHVYFGRGGGGTVLTKALNTFTIIFIALKKFQTLLNAVLIIFKLALAKVISNGYVTWLQSGWTLLDIEYKNK